MIDGSELSYSLTPGAITRRQLVYAALGVSFAASVPAVGRTCCQWSTEAEDAAEAALLLDIPVNDFNVSAGSLLDVLGELAASYNVPVSLIDADRPSCVSFTLHNGTVRQVLDRLVSCDRQYCWRQVMGRLIVLPHTSPYDSRIVGVRITDMPRMEAADAYIDHLNSHNVGFERLAGGVMLGDCTGSAYTTHVTLSPDATALEHFMQILAADRSLRFCLSRGIDELRFYSLANVRAKPVLSSKFARLTKWLSGTTALRK